ncbi:MAG: hypothetical protein GX326_06285 [Clostridiaceae bacterium]|nr:hypothetical protein [Clostridiaceae bacterium]
MKAGSNIRFVLVVLLVISLSYFLFVSNEPEPLNMTGVNRIIKKAENDETDFETIDKTDINFSYELLMK